jgi:hypothetical protein
MLTKRFPDYMTSMVSRIRVIVDKVLINGCDGLADKFGNVLIGMFFD